MARTFNGSTQYLVNAAAALTAAPITLACWFNVDNTTGDHGLMSLTDTAGNANWFTIYASGSGVGDPLAANVNGTGGSTEAVTSAGFSASTWEHACGVFASSTSRAAYLNGGSKGTDATNRTPAGIDATSIGNLARLTPTLYTAGRIAEAAIWDVALTDDEVLQLSRGVSPLFVRPGNLVAYWPLIGRTSPEIDVVGGLNLTLTNTPTVGDHCRIFYPHGGWASKRIAVSVTVNVAALGLVISQPTQTPTGGATTAAAALSIPINMPTQTTTGGVLVPAGVLSIPINQPAADTTGGSLYDAAAQAVAISQPGATASEERTVEVGTQAVTVSQPAIDSVTGGATLVVDPQAVTVSQPAQAATGGALHQPATSSVTVGQPSPTITGGASIDVGTQTITVGLDSVVASETTIVSVATVAVTANLLAPAVATGANFPAAVQTIIVSPIHPSFIGQPGGTTVGCVTTSHRLATRATCTHRRAGRVTPTERLVGRVTSTHSVCGEC